MTFSQWVLAKPSRAIALNLTVFVPAGCVILAATRDLAVAGPFLFVGISACIAFGFMRLKRSKREAPSA